MHLLLHGPTVLYIDIATKLHHVCLCFSLNLILEYVHLPYIQGGEAGNGVYGNVSHQPPLPPRASQRTTQPSPNTGGPPLPPRRNGPRYTNTVTLLLYSVGTSGQYIVYIHRQTSTKSSIQLPKEALVYYVKVAMRTIVQATAMLC